MQLFSEQLQWRDHAGLLMRMVTRSLCKRPPNDFGRMLARIFELYPRMVLAIAVLIVGIAATACGTNHAITAVTGPDSGLLDAEGSDSFTALMCDGGASAYPRI